MQTVSTSRTGPVTYIPGTEVAGDELRSFSDKPILSGPLVFQLCDADFPTTEISHGTKSITMQVKTNTGKRM